MNRIYLLLPVLLFFYACQEEEIVTDKTQIRFEVPLDAAAVADGEQFTVELSIDDASGNSVFTSEKLQLTKAGDYLVTDALSLPSGHYTINDFLISDSEEKVVYALPKRNSVLSSKLNHPVYQFVADRANGRDIAVNVLSVDGYRIVDFGYDAEKFRTYSFKLTVSVEDDERIIKTNATAYIQSNDGENYLYELDAKVNTVSFAGDPKKEYMLRIWKDGYEEFAKPFVYQELRGELHGQPLEVTLTKGSAETGPAVSLQPASDYFSMWIEVSGQGNIILDWGNGEKESLMFNVDPEDMTGTGYFSRDRQYDGSRLPVKLSGDVHLITALYFDTPVSSADLKSASALKGVLFTDAVISSLNLSTNSDLQWFSFFNCTIDALTLPQSHAVTNVMIESNSSWPSSSQLDYIIENVHANAVAGSRTQGYVSLVVPSISASAKEYLDELRTNYSWEVSY